MLEVKHRVAYYLPGAMIGNVAPPLFDLKKILFFFASSSASVSSRFCIDPLLPRVYTLGCSQRMR